MKYKKTIERISSGKLNRSELSKIKLNAEQKLNDGDEEARVVLEMLALAVPSDQYIIFMGFCPGADFNDRQDITWRKEKVCRLYHDESPVQIARFHSISPGDLIILKKRHVFGKTMKLFGHGRVTGISYDGKNNSYLNMDWSYQNEIIEVPLMACNSTIDIKSIESVEEEMPDDFFKWLNA